MPVLNCFAVFAAFLAFTGMFVVTVFMAACLLLFLFVNCFLFYILVFCFVMLMFAS